jgi:hypothetical protein
MAVFRDFCIAVFGGNGDRQLEFIESHLNLSAA